MASLVPVEIGLESTLVAVDGVVFRITEMTVDRSKKWLAAAQAFDAAFAGRREFGKRYLEWIGDHGLPTDGSEDPHAIERVQMAEERHRVGKELQAAAIAYCRCILFDRRDGHKRGESVTDEWIVEHVFESSKIEQLQAVQREVNDAGLSGMGNLLRAL